VKHYHWHTQKLNGIRNLQLLSYTLTYHQNKGIKNFFLFQVMPELRKTHRLH
jgi:hypothetical protein